MSPARWRFDSVACRTATRSLAALSLLCSALTAMPSALAQPTGPQPTGTQPTSPGNSQPPAAAEAQPTDPAPQGDNQKGDDQPSERAASRPDAPQPPPAADDSAATAAAHPSRRKSHPSRRKQGAPADNGAAADNPSADRSGADRSTAVAANKTNKTAEKPHEGRFAFGTYGRVMAAGDVRGRPGRNADITAFGSRLDHQSYVELELRREDHWADVEADTKIVATLAVAHPAFHYNGDFDAQLAVRNLFIEERDLGVKGVSIWAGSRMLRGDDIYILDFWPLDNLNTIGGGAFVDLPSKTQISAHMGLGQPNNLFYRQQSQRPVPLNQFGAANVDILDRQRWIGSARVQQTIPLSDKAGIKVVGYGELHQVPEGQRETLDPGTYEDVPHESGYLIGAQLVGYTGERDTHINLYARYARGIAAYGAFANPQGLDIDGSVGSAHEVLLAAGGNIEFGPVAVMLGAYFRSFRNASEALDFGDVDEGIVIVRPQVWFLDWLGLGVEGSFQGQQRGVITTAANDPGDEVAKPLLARVARIGVIPFITPAGRGSYKRPHFHFTYSASFRDAGARALYPTDDVFATREVEHFLGFGAEWWFGSTSYAR